MHEVFFFSHPSQTTRIELDWIDFACVYKLNSNNNNKPKKKINNETIPSACIGLVCKRARHLVSIAFWNWFVQMSANERNINELPDELLEFILGHMPPYADLQNCALVCKRWTDIVRSEYNLGWPKCSDYVVVVVVVTIRSCHWRIHDFDIDFFFEIIHFIESNHSDDSMQFFSYLFKMYLVENNRCTSAHSPQLPQRLDRFPIVLESSDQRGETNDCWPFFAFGHCV